MVNNPLHIEKKKKKEHEHSELQTCHAFFALREWALPLRRLLLCFWIITVNPTFVTRYDPRDKSWVLVSLLL
jgi:hypothetical protein